jgi:hypothetical protein
MKNTIMSSFKLALAGLAFLFATSQAHAAVAPPADFDFGTVGTGEYTTSVPLPNPDPNVLWFQFSLDATSLVNISTLGSMGEGPLDTVLALYDNTGVVLDQNDECNLDSGYSCLQFNSLDSGVYLAGVTLFSGMFIDGWMLDPGPGSGAGTIDFTLTVRQISAVPAPAAIWLFGSALVGFVGMSRRTTVKS